MITQSELKKLFEYRDGNLYWKVATSPRVKVGSLAGSINGKYLGTRYKRKITANHRIIFMMHHGYFPKEIDYIDGNKLNNCIENLRAATRHENMRNCKTNGKKTLTGCKNVSFEKRTASYVVRVVVNNKLTHIGTFKNLELADLVAHEARNKHYGEFANHGY
jgi:hypothetical protein